MSQIPDALRVTLEDRVREQIASEVRRDVSSLYRFTLPSIRERRVAEVVDEPELSLCDIRYFVEHVHSAEVASIEVEQFHRAVERFAGCPAAIVITRVRYNQSEQPAEFRCIWVYSTDTWFCTSLGKLWPSADQPVLS